MRGGWLRAVPCMRCEHGVRAVRVQRNSFEQITENPLIDLLLVGRRHIEKADSALARKRRPHNFGPRLDLQPWVTEFKADPHLLFWAQGRDHLHANAGTGQIAYDATICLIERDIGKRTEFMPMLCSCLTRGCVHIHHSLPEFAGRQRVLTRMLSRIPGWA